MKRRLILALVLVVAIFLALVFAAPLTSSPELEAHGYGYYIGK